jgi:hypothetical protein
MANLIYDKTEKGQEEIQTRKHHLASRMRSLLVLVDGKSNGEALLKKVSGLGLTEQSLAELVEQGFIAPRTENKAESKTEANLQQAHITVTEPASTTTTPASEAAPAEVAQASTTPAAPQSEDYSHYQVLYNFYTSTIKSVLGLRGYGLQLKVERCTTMDDFRALRQSYVDAIQKSQGPDMAISLANRLDALLASESPH